tara:strand:+ start:197 stop:430 length:234 start_codon:yes stop_codon:yes gene_type:complete
MKSYLFLISGFIFGIWISWPGIIAYKNWECFFEIIEKSKKDKLSLKAAFSVSPKFLLRGESRDNVSKLRIVSDACFR